MKKWKRCIWFIEQGWTKVHAVVGIDGAKTLCGIKRSTRRVLNSEKNRLKLNPFEGRYQNCKKCQAVTKGRYGGLNAYTVPA